MPQKPTFEVVVYSKPFTHDAAALHKPWNDLLEINENAYPFMRFEYLAALELSGSATRKTGWAAHAVTIWNGGVMHAACMVYVKSHSYGEYVFDFAWAQAYDQHGLAYYPKAVIAVPFTPVPGPRLLARGTDAGQALLKATVQWCDSQGLSSLHVLFASKADLQTCSDTGLMSRHTVQFHWNNQSPSYASFDDFLATLSQEKRKKIRQERRKVAQAGVVFRHSRGAQIIGHDWDFFYQCYEQTYLEHGNAPYLTRDFFRHMAETMAENWLLFIAERNGKPIASSLIAINPYAMGGGVAYGRYWGALERVDCLHFEACYYQPLKWCIAHGYERFEGGAQGEHKMARALLPVKTSSAHWLAHPSFADAVDRFLAREENGIQGYLDHLQVRSPFKSNT
jgi:predicted N-acyltransferase